MSKKIEIDKVRKQHAFYERQVNECRECIIPCKICPLGLTSTHFTRKLNGLKTKLWIYGVWFDERSDVHFAVMES
jgi:hypothetical protein